MKPAVVLIGGAPGAGKTTLGRALGARIDASSLTVDDLLTAVQAVTTPESHPGLHVMRAVDSIDYFTTNPVEQLTADATRQHEATWLAVEGVIRKHARWGPPVVIDGWSMRPAWVAELDFASVASFWMVIDDAVLENRERRNVDFFGRSTDPERMLRHFLGRSRWHNDLIHREAAAHHMKILHQDGSASVDELCAMAVAHLDGGDW